MLNIRKTSLLVAIGLVLSIAISTVATAQWEPDFNDEAAAGAFFGLAFLTCIIPIIWLVIAIIIAIWVYRDAEKRGSSGALWLIIVIITGIIGLIIWLVVRPPVGGEKKQGSGRTCPNCGRPIPMDARVCPYCSKKFED